MQGGFDDRQKLRRAEIERNRELKKQAELDDLVLEPRRMAEAGQDVAEIVAAMQRLGSPISEDDVQAIVDDVRDQDRRRAELRSEGIATATDPQVNHQIRAGSAPVPACSRFKEHTQDRPYH